MAQKVTLNPDGSVPAEWYDEDYWERGAESGKMSYNGNDYANNVEACKFWARDTFNRWGPFETYLELGCGRGWAIRGFQHLPELGIKKTTGVDFSHYAIETAHIDAKPHLIEHTIVDLSFIQDKSYDLIFSNDVLEHLTKDQVISCLQHCKRIAIKKVVHLISVGDGVDIASGYIPDDQDQSHVTLKPGDWWINRFVEIFGTQRSGPSADVWNMTIKPHGRTIEIEVTKL